MPEQDVLVKIDFKEFLDHPFTVELASSEKILEKRDFAKSQSSQQASFSTAALPYGKYQVTVRVGEGDNQVVKSAELLKVEPLKGEFWLDRQVSPYRRQAFFPFGWYAHAIQTRQKHTWIQSWYTLYTSREAGSGFAQTRTWGKRCNLSVSGIQCGWSWKIFRKRSAGQV